MMGTGKLRSRLTLMYLDKARLPMGMQSCTAFALLLAHAPILGRKHQLVGGEVVKGFKMYKGYPKFICHVFHKLRAHR